MGLYDHYIAPLTFDIGSQFPAILVPSINRLSDIIRRMDCTLNGTGNVLRLCSNDSTTIAQWSSDEYSPLQSCKFMHSYQLEGRRLMHHHPHRTRTNRASRVRSLSLEIMRLVQTVP